MLTYKRARAHAQQCGVDVSRFMAVPVARMRRGFYMLSHDVQCPVTGVSLMLAGDIAPRECFQDMAREMGFDYIICYK